MKMFKNKFGSIPSGTKVTFEVENADMWSGDRAGILTFKDDKWVIKTENSGVIQINEWLGAYGETIKPVTEDVYKSLLGDTPNSIYNILNSILNISRSFDRRLKNLEAKFK